MIQRITFVLVFVLSQSIFSQELFFSKGENNTRYDYTNSLGQSNPNIHSSVGNFYELGLVFGFDKSTSVLENKFVYDLSLTLNQFNAKGGDYNNTYSWKTNYLGFQNAVSYLLYGSDVFSFRFKGGLTTSTIVSGEQNKNNTYYTLKDSEFKDQFKGLVLGPLVGISIRYQVTPVFGLGAGYNYSRSYNVTTNNSEKLVFQTNQLQFGVYIKI